MNRFFFLLMALSALALARPINDGNKLFAKGDYSGAIEKYQKVTPAEQSTPLYYYNMGTSLYHLDRFEEAKEKLSLASYSLDPTIASKAFYNLASVYYRLGEKTSEPSDRIEKWRQSIAFFKKTVDSNPNMDKAKQNIEIVQRKLKEEIDKQKEQQNEDSKHPSPELSEAAKQAKARALQLSKEEKYAEAKKVLEEIISIDSTASPLAPYMQRTDDIIEINAGRKPKSKIETNDTDNDLEVI